jgi:hypothetical protein
MTSERSDEMPLIRHLGVSIDDGSCGGDNSNVGYDPEDRLKDDDDDDLHIKNQHINRDTFDHETLATMFSREAGSMILDHDDDFNSMLVGEAKYIIEDLHLLERVSSVITGSHAAPLERTRGRLSESRSHNVNKVDLIVHEQNEKILDPIQETADEGVINTKKSTSFVDGQQGFYTVAKPEEESTEGAITEDSTSVELDSLTTKSRNLPITMSMEAAGIEVYLSGKVVEESGEEVCFTDTIATPVLDEGIVLEQRSKKLVKRAVSKISKVMKRIRLSECVRKRDENFTRFEI